MRGKLFVIATSILSMLPVSVLSTDKAMAGNSGAAFVGGMIGGAIGSAIVNGQKRPSKSKATTTKKKAATSKTRAVTKQNAAPAAAASAASSAPWMATPMPNGLMVATNAQGLLFTYDVRGLPRLIIQPTTAVPAASAGMLIPVSIVVDGSVFGLLNAKADAAGLIIDDPQVLGLEQRLKPAKEVIVTSSFSATTVKLSGFTKAIDQLGVFRQQQVLLAAANPPLVSTNNQASTAPGIQQVSSGSAASDVVAAPSVQPVAVAQPIAAETVTAMVQPSVVGAAQQAEAPAPTIVAGARKVALVIGNGAYENAGQLANPKNDAAAITRVLEGIGFKVIVATDASKSAMETSIREFIQDARSADVSLFFYSGHGMEVSGENFLLPVDAKLADEAALSFEVINSKVITNAMGGEKKVGIILLDACRDNPFTKSLRRAMVASRAANVSNGLAPISAEGGGLVVAFATSPGDVAADGDGVNSPFTTALINWLPQKGLEIDQVMKRVKSEVATVTNNDQRPWTNSDLTSDVFLAGQVN